MWHTRYVLRYAIRRVYELAGALVVLIGSLVIGDSAASVDEGALSVEVYDDGESSMVEDAAFSVVEGLTTVIEGLDSFMLEVDITSEDCSAVAGSFGVVPTFTPKRDGALSIWFSGLLSLAGTTLVSAITAGGAMASSMWIS